MKTRGVRNLGEWDRQYAMDRRSMAAGILARFTDDGIPLARLAEIMGVPPNGLRSTLAPDNLFLFTIVRHPQHRRGVCQVRLNPEARIRVDEVARVVGVDSRPRLAGPKQKS
jgi:hypothetical protein